MDIIDPHAVVTHRSPPPPRPDWDAYFMGFAKLACSRASCIRRQVGAVIVKDNMVLTTGYNGAPRGLPHASEVGCLRDRLGVPSGQRHELCRGLHAEQNAIIQAARHGISIEGAMMYCTTHPCVICIKMIINAGLTHVYYLQGYADEIAKSIIAEAGFPVIQMRDPEAPAAGRRGLPILSQGAF
ncbi:MAG TPA: dCMP deaminase family protein [Myxococcota bacterium]|nr:dCMP deaminase family protein [Myxococcota bacterium]